MKVKAIEKGHFGVIRNVGDVFEIDNIKQKGSWMELVGEAPPEQVPPVPPVTPVTPNAEGTTLGDVNQKAIDAQSTPEFLS